MCLHRATGLPITAPCACPDVLPDTMSCQDPLCPPSRPQPHSPDLKPTEPSPASADLPLKAFSPHPPLSLPWVSFLRGAPATGNHLACWLRSTLTRLQLHQSAGQSCLLHPSLLRALTIAFWPCPAQPLPGVIVMSPWDSGGRMEGILGDVGHENGLGEWQPEPQVWTASAQAEMQGPFQL